MSQFITSLELFLQLSAQMGTHVLFAILGGSSAKRWAT